MNQPIIILGMPRCRTAWLSMVLSALGHNVTHEAMRDCGGFQAWADQLQERLQRGPAGDADPALVLWAKEILGRWPKAKFIAVQRDDAAGLEAFIKALPERYAQQLRANWGNYLVACKGAFDFLRSSGADLFSAGLDQMRHDVFVSKLLEFATGHKPDPLFVKRMQRLKVTAAETEPAPLEQKPAQPVAIPTLERFDIRGLSARLYTNEDYDMVAAWWKHHNKEGFLPQAGLPPLGVVVTLRGEPVCAVWCYESYGVPVGELAMPITKPGLSLKQASAALAYAFCVCMNSAGKGTVPQGSFRFFKAFSPKPMTRFLKRMGFEVMAGDREVLTIKI